MKEVLEQMEAISYKVNRLCDTADFLERCDLERDKFVTQVFSGSFQLFNEAMHSLHEMVDKFYSGLYALTKNNHDEHS